MMRSIRITFLFAMCALMTNLQGLAAEDNCPANMVVQGHAILKKPADELHLTVGVISQAEQATDALRSNNQKIQGVIQELTKLGLSDQEYQTSRFSIHPVYATPPKEPPPNWTPIIVGYEVTNQITIRTEKLDLAGPIIDASSRSGANSVDDISFVLKDPRAYQAEAITLATQHAMADAQQLAQAAHIELLRVLSISLNHAQPAPSPRFVQYAFKSGEMGGGTPIKSGDIEITADVSMTYEIR